MEINENKTKSSKYYLPGYKRSHNNLLILIEIEKKIHKRSKKTSFDMIVKHVF